MPEIEEVPEVDEALKAAKVEILNDDIKKVNIKKDEEEEEEIEVLTEEERSKRIDDTNTFKAEGNRLFKSNEYELSVEQYKKALEQCPKDSKELLVILYSNIAAATDHLGTHEDAIEYCNQALKLNPQHIKALLRRAQLHRKCDKLDESLADYEEYCKLVPDDRPAKRVVQELNVQITDSNEKLKTEMMGKLKDLGNMFLKPFGLSTENFQMVKNPESGNYSVNFNNGKPQ